MKSKIVKLWGFPLLPVLILAQEPVKIGHVSFYTYTTAEPSKEIEIQFGNVQNSPLIPGVETFLVIDGFLRNRSHEMSQNIKNRLLRVAPNSNTIVVDWGNFSGANSGLEFGTGTAFDSIRLFGLYDDVARKHVRPVGMYIARFLEELKLAKHIQFSQVHVIGFSMGAHIGGIMGLELIQKYGGRLGRISALDPAGPSYQNEKNLNRKLDRGDADFVDVYHSNRYSLGDGSRGVGHVNLYLNGGKGPQPGCEDEVFLNQAMCNHWYGHRLWTLSIENIIQACQCQGVLDCECRTCSRSCSKPLRVGLEMPTSARGDFVVQSKLTGQRMRVEKGLAVVGLNIISLKSSGKYL